MRSFITRKDSSSCSASTEESATDKTKSVMQLVRKKGPPLTNKQMQFCNEACIGRFLKSKGNNIKKAAKQLRATVNWRANLDVDYLTADEFSAELALGSAFVAGHDEEDRPVVIVRLKPENLTGQAQKQFLRYFVFTMEVAISRMAGSVQQLVLILDASFMKRSSAPSAGVSAVVQLLKVLGEHYPERLSRAFIVDAPSMFYLLWKGLGKFVDTKMTERLRFVFSRNYNTSSNSVGDEDGEDLKTSRIFPEVKTPRKSISKATSSLFSSSSASKSISLSSSTPCKTGPLLTSDKRHARSLSFASTPNMCTKQDSADFQSFRFDTKASRVSQEDNSSSRRWTDLAFISGRDEFLGYQNQLCHKDLSQKDKSLSLFRPYYTAFFVLPYNEESYRALIKPPLAGLLSIISPELKSRRPSFCLNSMATVEAVLHHLQL